MGHTLMENRHGLAVLGGVSQATGTAERDQALELIDRHREIEVQIAGLLLCTPPNGEPPA
mgnify:CR=1 FL=1